jgi:hypothetical protein
VIDVSAGAGGGLVLKADGSVWAWGTDLDGSLRAAGVPAGASAPAPIQVPLPPGPPVVDVEMKNACHALALRADGSLLVWGCDFFEQAGDGPGGGVAATPTVITPPGASVVSLANSMWNGLVLARPVHDPEWERPATWVEAAVADAAVGEGAGGRFTIGLSATLPHPVTVAWSLREGTAGAGDVALGDGTATVPAGAESVEVELPLVDDALDEDAETFTIELRDVSHGIRLARSQATGTIADDDDPPAVSVQPAAVAEGNTSLTDAAVAVQLSAPSGKPVSISFATADGTATAPSDYGAASGRLTIAPGETGTVVHVGVRGDELVEPEESLTVSLSEPENATLGTASAPVAIGDDEPVVLSVASPRVVEGDGGTTPATFAVALAPAAPPGTSVSLRYELQGLGASVPEDVAPASGTLELAPGESSKQVTVDVRGDVAKEPNEAFRLVLTDVVATGGRPVLRGEGTVALIVDDDGEGTDSTPPVTVATRTPPPNAAGWNRGNVVVTLVATDEGGSGVKEVRYRVGDRAERTVAGDRAAFTLSAEGVTTVRYRAADDAGNVEAERTLTVRIDKTAPTLTCAAAPAVLQPADHRLVPVHVDVQAGDALSGPAGLELVLARSSEPDDAKGEADGTTVDDLQGFDVGAADVTGLLRAERAEGGPGRVYRLSYTARDRASNERTCKVLVTVPA